MIYYTSDWHLGHARVAEIRGFDSAAEHDDWVMSLCEPLTWNDTLYILGDVIGRDRDWDQAKFLLNAVAGRVREQLHLVAGNHDPCHPCRSESIQWERRYLTVFSSVSPYRVRRLEGKRLHMSHFPVITGDGHDDRDPEDIRWPEWRLPKSDHPTIHGHLHTEVKDHGNQYHIGVDAHGALVPESTIAAWLRSLDQQQEELKAA